MAKKSSFVNMVVVLGLVCLICSALLGAVYVVTEAPIAAANLAKTNQAISEVVPAFDNVPSDEKFTVSVGGKEYLVYPAKAQGSVAGYAVECSVIGFGGPVKIMVGFDAAGNIYHSSVISHSETPGLGAKISDNSQGNFREQFKGKNPKDYKLKVKQDGGDVDAITASTITSRAYTSAVKEACDVFDAIAVKAGEGQNNE